ncbi:MAG: hypothetical protein QM652_13395 [Legionella sp.]|uniref:hypothetical protein n=1 Tax=Legionella sp. TaxID=459 RepID=UPI0039E4BE32
MSNINSHRMYNTISHEHLDDLINWVIGEYPDSGLILVECEDGRWFIEQEYGHAYDSFSGISKPKLEPYLEPNFYTNRNKALAMAIELIKRVYKNIDETKISEYFNEGDKRLN